MTRFFAILAILALLASAAEAETADRWNKAEIDRALDNLQRLDHPYFDKQRLKALEQRLAKGTTVPNDDAALCIGALAIPFGAAFGFGLVPNPPFDYLGGHLPAFAANLALKFCPPVVEAPADLRVHPNVDTADGPNCAYDFSQRRRQDVRGDFLGIPLDPVDDWTGGEPGSIDLGQPSMFHYNSDVKLTLLDPDFDPPGLFEQVTPESLAANVLPLGILPPQFDPSSDGCRDDGSVALGDDGSPCPVVMDRKRRLGVGAHTLSWRGDTQIGLLDVLPPVYVPSKPPGSKSQLAKKILQNVAEATFDGIVGSFLEGYSHGIHNTASQSVWVYDTVTPTLASSPLNFTIEASAVGGERSRDHVGTLREALIPADACNRPLNINHTGIAPFWNLGTHQVEWYARDPGPNLSGTFNEATIVQTIVVEDTRAPEIKAPPSIVVEADTAPVTISLGSPLVFDVVDLEPVIVNDAPADFGFGTTVVNWQATDGSGNTSPSVQQYVTVKATGSNNSPTADSGSADAISFEPVTIELSGSDADGDRLYFYIEDEPDEGFFEIPALPFFVDDVRVDRVDRPTLEALCAAGDPLPPQNFVYQPEFITVTDEGDTFVIDDQFYCSTSNPGADLFSRDRIARIGADGELVGEYLFQGGSQIIKLSFHPDGFVYWVNDATENLLVIDDAFQNPVEVIPLDQLPSGVTQLNNFMDAAIDPAGILYVMDRSKLYAFDFNDRGSSNEPAYLGMITPSEFYFGEAWDLDIDRDGNLFVADREVDRIHKFSASGFDENGAFVPGELVGWLGRCATDLAPGDAAHCDVANERSIGFSCTDATCGVLTADGTNCGPYISGPCTAGEQPGQFEEPRGITLSPDGVLYATDYGNLRVQRFTPEGFFAGQAISACDGDCFVVGDFGRPRDVSVNSRNFYVLNFEEDILHIFEATPITVTGPDTAEVTYRSNNNFIGTDSFGFSTSDGLRIDDQLQKSTPATVTIDVTRNFRAPFATPGISATLDEDSSVVITLDGSDPDVGSIYPWEPLDVLSFAIASAPTHGQVSVVGNQATYVPDPDYNGPDAFSFTASDGNATSAPETVELTVQPTNDDPLAELPDVIEAGIGFAFSVRASVSDPDETDDLDLLLDWGDGTVETEGTLTNDGNQTGPILENNAGGEGTVAAKHTYFEAPANEVELCVMDLAGSMRCDTRAVAIVPMVDLSLTGQDLVDPVPQGNTIQLRYRVRNEEPNDAIGIDATGVMLEVDFDPRLSHVGTTGTGCSLTGSTVSCTLGTLAPGSEELVDIELAPPVTAPVGTVYETRAEASATETDATGTNRDIESTVLVAGADFLVSSTPARDDSPDANPGDGLCANADGECSLRAAITEANALAGPQTIALAPGVHWLTQDTGSDDDIEVTDTLEITGAGAASTLITTRAADRLFDLTGTLVLRSLGLSGAGDDTLDGGAILVRSGGMLELYDVDVADNEGNNGGGIAVQAGGMATIHRSSFLRNRANSGGGIWSEGELLVESTSLADNRADYNGGVLTSGTGDFLNVSMVGNQARFTGGNLGVAIGETATIRNSLLAAGSAILGADCEAASLVSQGHNLIESTEGCTVSATTGDLFEVSAQRQPRARGRNGTSGFMPLEAGNLVNAGDDVECPELDQFGRPRTSCDIGAVEFLSEGIFASGFE